MKKFREYTKVIAIKEMSAGNESVGDMWLETKSFDSCDKLRDVLDWGSNCSGKLILSIDEDTSTDDIPF